MTTTAETLRSYRGPALFSYGFRPFFLGGAVWAVMTMALFVAMIWGGVELPSGFGAVDWHAHELVYGYLSAIIAGFLLTAVPNWTGRLPVAGTPLAALFAIWVVGRIAVACSALIGAPAAAFIDLAFIVALTGIAAREIIAGSNSKNLKVLVIIGVFGLGNALFHAEVALQGTADYGKRIGIAAAIMLIVLIGGRVVPSFTRNWLAKAGEARLPAPFGRFDVAAIASAALALLSWIVWPDGAVTVALCAFAGAMHVVRLARWRGWLTFSEPLVSVLHAGYLFIPIGFMLVALSIASPTLVAPISAIHAWTAGAIGLMTLAIMTRASLGHTGRMLSATPATVAIYIAAAGGALARILAGFDIAPDLMLKLGATAWIGAFAVFVAFYAPMLATPRAQ